MALYKMPSFKGYSSYLSTLWTNIYSLIFALIVFWFLGKGQIPLTTISWFGILWGVFFAITMLLQKTLLKRAETNVLLPVTSSLESVLTVLTGVILFSEHISFVQSVGMIGVILAVFLFGRKKGEFPLDFSALSISCGIVLASTVTKYIQKIGATHDTIYHFATYQFVGAIVAALTLIFLFEKKSLCIIFSIKETWKITLITAFFATVGGYALLNALKTGPLSGVYSIQPSYIFITAILGSFLYKEKITLQKIIFMTICVAGVILIKIG